MSATRSLNVLNQTNRNYKLKSPEVPSKQAVTPQIGWPGKQPAMDAQEARAGRKMGGWNGGRPTLKGWRNPRYMLALQSLHRSFAVRIVCRFNPGALRHHLAWQDLQHSLPIPSQTGQKNGDNSWKFSCLVALPLRLQLSFPTSCSNPHWQR